MLARRGICIATWAAATLGWNVPFLTETFDEKQAYHFAASGGPWGADGVLHASESAAVSRRRQLLRRQGQGDLPDFDALCDRRGDLPDLRKPKLQRGCVGGHGLG